MTAKVTLSTNAGVMLEYDGKKLLVDALHHFDVPTFSKVPLDVLELMVARGAFSDADMLFVSHDHPDHYSREWVSAYLKNNLRTFCAAPFKIAERQLVLNGSDGKFRHGDINVSFFRTPHEKQNVYADVKHYSFAVEFSGKRFAFLNDAEIEAEHMERMFEKPADIAFLNFPWLTLKHARGLVNEYVRASNIVIYHLPVPGEDSFGFAAVEKKSESLITVPDVKIRALSVPLSEAEFEL